ncbi:MAG: [FeFe] hydrogenase H-cluster radical SAM maturase HydG [Bacteroidetes bacterium HGW-Bacteroidetes-17]|jgi:2-iminoacetate synthase|nr:MAG: [FeFe] hydrogenase H-cluster radical SAM maturase HydG [Bacteroidetes bacterium HGW-Bacteroidetes-17]
MIFKPQKYRIKDESMINFIDPEEINDYLNRAKPTTDMVRQVIEKSLNKERLNLEDVALLVKATDLEQIEMIKDGAKTLKRNIYGNRIVLFAPLYVGNLCNNNCKYCGFRASNSKAERKTLNDQELYENVVALEQNGQKRLILVFGEHQKYNAQYIADTVRKVYNIKSGNGEIRRVNINAAPLDIADFKTVKESGIGTYQIFQETYHPEAYKKYHLSGKKADYNYRVTSLDRAMEAGIDDVGIGVLFGLYDWRYEVLALVRHTNHLEACYNVGPHTISFPRLQKALNLDVDEQYLVNDEEFTRIIAILRLAVPYTGMILTARETAEIRREVLQYGCSQIDAGTKIEIGAYAEKFQKNQELKKEQFQINDNRSLNDVIEELIEQDYLPSFCTACYRLGRTGEHFMEFSVPGFIKRYCSSNAMLTLAEYLMDYAPPETAEKGWKLIEKSMLDLEGFQNIDEVHARLMRIKNGERDLYF